MRGIYFDGTQLDRQKLGQTILSLGSYAIDQVQKDIKNSGLDCADVLFENLTSDPIGQVKAVYKQFNWTFTDEYEKVLKDYLEENHKQREATKAKLSKAGEKKTVLHDHKPEDFGINREDLQRGVYGDYIRRFHITSSK